MDGFRRTQPRSVRHPARMPAEPQPPRQPPKSPAMRTGYVPWFGRDSLIPPTTPTASAAVAPAVATTPSQSQSQNDGGQDNESNTAKKMLPRVRQDPTRITGPGRTSVEFCDGPQNIVRWLPVPERFAVAAAGSADGDCDSVCLFSVWSDGECVRHALQRRVPHVGKTSAIAVDEDGNFVVASSRGALSFLQGARWSEAPLEDVGNLKDIRKRKEGIVAAAMVQDRAAVAGEHGTLAVFDLGVAKIVDGMSRLRWGAKFDETGFRALTAVDQSRHLVAGAGGVGVATWDLRTGELVQRLATSRRTAVTAVATDPAQRHFIMGGLADGGVCVWDRRKSANSDAAAIVAGMPVREAMVHDGAVWDVGVVRAGRPGRLVTAGEDGMALVVDFGRDGANAAAVGAEFWDGHVQDGDVRSLIGNTRVGMGVNSVDTHASADLFAYASDAAVVGFGALSAV